MTTLTDSIAADQTAVANAVAALDAANTQLAADQASLDAIQPHLTVLAELEAQAAGWESAVADDVRSAIARIRALLGA